MFRITVSIRVVLENEWEQVSEKRLVSSLKEVSFNAHVCNCVCLPKKTWVVSVGELVVVLLSKPKTHWSQSIRFPFTSYDCSNFKAKAKHLHVCIWDSICWVSVTGQCGECVLYCVLCAQWNLTYNIHSGRTAPQPLVWRGHSIKFYCSLS